MTEFTIHTSDSAPQDSKPILESIKRQLGVIPNVLSVMAESTVTLEAYQTLSKLFDKTAFTTTERQLIMLSISRFRNCCYCLASHGSRAKQEKIPQQIINAVYYKQPLDDYKLEALRTFTYSLLKSDGWVNKNALQAFYQAGYEQNHVLEVILGVSFKTISNYLNHINNTPIDSEFISGIPENQHAHST